MLLTVGCYDEAPPPLERAVQMYREARDLEGAGRAAALLGRAHLVRGAPQDGLAGVETMVEMLAWIGPSSVLSSLHIALGAIFQGLGRHDEMRRAAERAVEIAETIGDERLLGWALVQRGSALTSLGRSSEARQILEEAIPLLEGVGDLARLQMASLSSATSYAVYLPTTLGQVHLAMGTWEEAEAEAALQRALGIAESGGDPQAQDMVHRALAELEVLRGNPDTAIGRSEPRAGREGSFRVPIETTLAWALLHAGDVNRADVLAGETVGRTREQGEVLALVDALRVRGMVLARQGRIDEAAKILEEGLART